MRILEKPFEHGDEAPRRDRVNNSRNILASTALLGACIAFALGTGHACEADGHASQDALMKSADRGAANWLSYRRTYSEQSFSPLSKIDTHNAQRLGFAGYADLDTNRAQEVTPLVA